MKTYSAAPIRAIDVHFVGSPGEVLDVFGPGNASRGGLPGPVRDIQGGQGGRAHRCGAAALEQERVPL